MEENPGVARLLFHPRPRDGDRHQVQWLCELLSKGRTTGSDASVAVAAAAASSAAAAAAASSAAAAAAAAASSAASSAAISSDDYGNGSGNAVVTEGAMLAIAVSNGPGNRSIGWDMPRRRLPIHESWLGLISAARRRNCRISA